MNNGRDGKSLAGMNARCGAMHNGQSPTICGQHLEVPTPAAHHTSRDAAYGDSKEGK